MQRLSLCVHPLFWSSEAGEELQVASSLQCRSSNSCFFSVTAVLRVFVSAKQSGAVQGVTAQTCHSSSGTGSTGTLLGVASPAPGQNLGTVTM